MALSVAEMISDGLMDTYNFMKHDAYKNSPTAEITGKAVQLNVCKNPPVIIDVDINHSYDDNQKSLIADDIVNKLKDLQDDFPVKCTRSGGLHIICLDDPDFDNEKYKLCYSNKNGWCKCIQTEDFDVDILRGVNKKKRQLVMWNGKAKNDNEPDEKIGEYNWYNGNENSIVKYKYTEVLNHLHFTELLKPIENDDENKLLQDMLDTVRPEENTITNTNSNTYTKELIDTIIKVFDFTADGYRKNNTGKHKKEEIHANCDKKANEEISIVKIVADLYYAIQHSDIEDEEYIEELKDYLWENANLSDECKKQWNRRISDGKKMNDDKKIFNIGYLINAAKFLNEKYYTEHILPLLSTTTNKKPEKIIVHPIDFYDSFSFNDLRENIAYNKYKSINPIVNDLTKLIRFVDEGSSMYVRKDNNKISYLTLKTMEQYANNCKDIQLPNENKPIKLWMVIKSHAHIFKVNGVKFFTEEKNYISFFHGYKYDTNNTFANNNNNNEISEEELPELYEEPSTDEILDESYIQMFIDFIKEVISDYNEKDEEKDEEEKDEEEKEKKKKVYEYIINWISYIMQNPGKKNGTAIVIKGLQGTGKNTFTDTLCEMLSGYSEPNITDLDEITGKNNKVIENKKLIIANEAKNAGDDKYANFDSLKSKITDATVRVGEKYEPARTVDNVANYIICTNNPNPVKVEKSDRRYLIIIPSYCKMNKHEYWKQLYELMYINGDKSKPNKKFFTNLTKYFLLHDISNYNPCDIPETEEKKDLIKVSERPIENWIKENYKELSSTYGMEAQDVMDKKPPIKPKYFYNELKTYCKKWQPRINKKKSSTWYYKLKTDCEKLFKDDEPIVDNILNDGR